MSSRRSTRRCVGGGCWMIGDVGDGGDGESLARWSRRKMLKRSVKIWAYWARAWASGPGFLVLGFVSIPLGLI